MRFSSTTADCVAVTVSPPGFLVGARASMPMYCSPSKPLVKIFSELSQGKV